MKTPPESIPSSLNPAPSTDQTSTHAQPDRSTVEKPRHSGASPTNTPHISKPQLLPRTYQPPAPSTAVPATAQDAQIGALLSSDSLVWDATGEPLVGRTSDWRHRKKGWKASKDLVETEKAGKIVIDGMEMVERNARGSRQLASKKGKSKTGIGTSAAMTPPPLANAHAARTSLPIRQPTPSNPSSALQQSPAEVRTSLIRTRLRARLHRFLERDYARVHGD